MGQIRRWDIVRKSKVSIDTKRCQKSDFPKKGKFLFAWKQKFHYLLPLASHSLLMKHDRIVVLQKINQHFSVWNGYYWIFNTICSMERKEHGKLIDRDKINETILFYCNLYMPMLMWAWVKCLLGVRASD